MNVENLRKCIEQSPVLQFTYQTKTDCCKNGVAQSMTVEGSCRVNYEEKTAVSTIKTSVAEGIAIIEKAVYRDCKVVKTAIQTGVLNEDAPHVQENLLSEKEYNSLFEEKGDLRPVNFDRLVLKSNDEQCPNTLSFIVESPEISGMEEAGMTDVQSAAVISLCSEDVMKLTQLSVFLSSKNPQDMTLVSHNLTVYL